MHYFLKKAALSSLIVEIFISARLKKYTAAADETDKRTDTLFPKAGKVMLKHRYAVAPQRIPPKSGFKKMLE
jgi:hypothetical protein